MFVAVFIIWIGWAIGSVLLYLRLKRELRTIQRPTRGRDFMFGFLGLLGSDAERRIFRRYWSHTLLMLLAGAMLFLLVIAVQVLLMRKDGVQWGGA